MSPCCTKTSITRPFLGRLGRNFYWNSPRHWSSTKQNFSPIGPKMAELRPIFQNFHWNAFFSSLLVTFWRGHGSLLKSGPLTLICRCHFFGHFVPLFDADMVTSQKLVQLAKKKFKFATLEIKIRNGNRLALNRVASTGNLLFSVSCQ